MPAPQAPGGRAEVRVGAPQPALNINMDALTNVETLTFSFNGDKKVLPVLMIQEPISKAPIPIPVPDVTPLNPPLGLIPPLPKKPIRRLALRMSQAKAHMLGMVTVAYDCPSFSAM